MSLNFTSFFFYIFIVVIAFTYYMVKKYQWIVLLFFSLIFYATWGWKAIPFIFASSVIAYYAALSITGRYTKCDDQINELTGSGADKAEIGKVKKTAKDHNRVILVISVILMLSLLVYVKAGNLLVGALSLSGEVSIIVPVGISYYTFSLIGYVADCYWRKEQAEGNYYKLLLFAAYFPKVLQGPISKYRDLAPQLFSTHQFDYKKLCYGIQRMLWGYFKKLVIADRLALFVNEVYGDYVHKSGSMLLVATVFGAFQLYCDFSGCMDIACGFSEILGIKLEENFRRPFFSESAAEFWRRWHITLGVWFKDYVYMPLSVSPRMMKLMSRVKSRFGMSVAKHVGTVLSLSVVWILTGLWHGTGWNYVVWGVYWGILIILGVLLEPAYRRLAELCHINTDSPEWRLFRRVRTFLLFMISRVLTIPGDIRISWDVFGRILTKFKPWELVDGKIFTMGLDRANFTAVSIFLILLLHVSRYQEAGDGRSVRDWLSERQIVARWILLYALFFGILIFGIYGPGYDASSFVYMKY